MTLPQTLEQALNRQLNSELSSAYIYLAMSAHCAARNLPGFAQWMLVQAREEAGHAMKIFRYLEDRSARVALAAVPQPPGEWPSPLHVFQDVLDHERAVSRQIDALYALAVEEKDYASQAFLQWFVTEQIEEEKTASQIVETLKLAGDSRPALLLLDRELGRRGGEG